MANNTYIDINIYEHVDEQGVIHMTTPPLPMMWICLPLHFISSRRVSPSIIVNNNNFIIDLHNNNSLSKAIVTFVWWATVTSKNAKYREDLFTIFLPYTNISYLMHFYLKKGYFLSWQL